MGAFAFLFHYSGEITGLMQSLRFLGHIFLLGLFFHVKTGLENLTTITQEKRCFYSLLLLAVVITEDSLRGAFFCCCCCCCSAHGDSWGEDYKRRMMWMEDKEPRKHPEKDELRGRRYEAVRFQHPIQEDSGGL